MRVREGCAGGYIGRYLSICIIDGPWKEGEGGRHIIISYHRGRKFTIIISILVPARWFYLLSNFHHTHMYICTIHTFFINFFVHSTSLLTHQLIHSIHTHAHPVSKIPFLSLLLSLMLLLLSRWVWWCTCVVDGRVEGMDMYLCTYIPG